MSDSELLRRFAELHDEAAFVQLVQQRIGLVYSAALRQVGDDAQRAGDIAQQVFIDLARKAPALWRHEALIGWLYTSAHFGAVRIIRADQRRTAREKEKESRAMPETPVVTVAGDAGERMRPVLDAAMHELEERDRQMVLMRFLDQQSFGRIGAQLGLTENVAQKRAERALDRLQAALERRGVTTSAGALAVSLPAQAGGTVPAGLAASVASAALAGAAVAPGNGAGTPGVLGILGGSRVFAAIAAAMAVAAVGIAVQQHRRARAAEEELAAANGERAAMRVQFVALEERVQRAEQRAAGAEKDNDELLKAVEAHRTQQAARAAETSAPAAPIEEDERLLRERAYQQDLARRRAAEAIARAKIDSELASADPLQKFHALLEAAAEHAARAEFQAAIRRYNQAMEAKPRDVAVPDDARELQALLQAQNDPVNITLTSDGMTFVEITGHRAPARFDATTIMLLPGNYEVIGRRRGFQDVVIPLQVRNGAPAPMVRVACTVRIDE